MRWWGRLLILGISAITIALLLEGLSPSSGSPTSTTTPPTTTTADGSELRPADAIAAGAEETVEEALDVNTRLELTFEDVLVIASVVALTLWLVLPPRRRRRPVSVRVVDATPEDEESRSEGSPPTDEAIAALVRDRLARVDLQPPASMPANDEAADGIISVAESVEAVKGVGSVAKALSALNPRRTLGHEARLVLRRSDTTVRAGITVELYDLDRRSAVVVKTVWASTFEEAARTVGFQIAARLLHELPRRDRRKRWWRWEESGRSLKEFEDAGWHIAQRRYDDAVRHLEDGLKADPSNLAIRLRLGQTYERLHMYPQALWLYQRVVNPRYRLRWSSRWSREARLIRWRSAIVLANAHLWAPTWMEDAIAHITPGEHDDVRRLRSFIEVRYARLLRREFRTFSRTVFADHEVRSTRFERRPRTRPLLPRSEPRPRLRFSLRQRHSARLVDDRSTWKTLTYCWNVLADQAGPPLAVGASRAGARVARDDVLLDVSTAVRHRHGHDELAPAISPVQLCWRASHVEIDQIGVLGRRRAGLTNVDRMAFHLGANTRQLRTRWRWTSADRLGLQRAALSVRLRALRLRALVPRTLAHRARAQAEYNVACALAIGIPPSPEGSARYWRKEHDAQIRKIVDLLMRACRGPHNLVELGAGRWVVLEDPDLETVRSHPVFCRFASAVLHREIDTSPLRSTDRSREHISNIERHAIEAAVAQWRETLRSDPGWSDDLVEQLRSDADLHRALQRALDTPRSTERRSSVQVAVRQLRPTSASAPSWPGGLDGPRDDGDAILTDEELSAGGRHHEKAADESEKLADAVQTYIDDRAVTAPPLSSPRTICRGRLDAWLAREAAHG